jgi:cytoskeleton protein RodZ
MTPADVAAAEAAGRDARPERTHLRLVTDGATIADPATPGGRLALRRQSLGLTPPMLADALNLKLRHIEAIEAQDFGKMPGLGYALGWVRAYAEHVGDPDPEAMVSAFRDLWEPVQRKGERWHTRPVLRRQVAPGVAVAAMAAGWVLTLAILGIALSPKPVDDQSAHDAEIKAWASARGPAPAGPVATDAAPRSRIIALAPVHVELRAGDGSVMAARTLRPGDSLDTDGIGIWSATVSDGAAVQVVTADRVFTGIGAPGLPVQGWRVPLPPAAPDVAAGTAAPAAAAGAATAPGAVAPPATTPPAAVASQTAPQPAIPTP